MPYSLLSVVNQTLSLIGKVPVTNINDSDASALIANRLTILTPDLLKQATWNFAIVFRIDDTPLVENFTPDFTYTYQLPGDFGRFDRFSYYQSQFGFNYRFVDNLLLCNIRPVQYYYVSSEAAYETFTVDFVIALAHYAASQTSLVLTQDEGLTKYLEEKYLYYFDKAVLSNDMERQVGMTPYNDYDRQVYI